MLKKKYRLPIYKRRGKTRTVDAGPFILKFSKNSLSNSRFGFSVSKAYDKRAVVRNRIKRIFRSIAQENQDYIEKGYDLLFIVKESARGQSREKLLETFRETLIKEKFINGKTSS